MYNPREVLTRPADAGVTLGYGSLSSQVFELHLRPGDKRGVVVFFHGGFWRDEYNRAHVRPLCHALAEDGHVVISVEYRRTGEHGGGGWPHTFDDIRNAVWAISHFLNQQKFDTLPLVLSGHSAGGHLALWAAAEFDPALPQTAQRYPRMRPLPPIAGVVPLAPVSDLAECFRADMDGDAAKLLMGGGPIEHPERYAQADPMARVIAAPTIVIHGDQDRQVPVEMSRRYAEAKGATLLEIPGTEHFGLIDPLSPAWPVVREAFNGFR